VAQKLVTNAVLAEKIEAHEWVSGLSQARTACSSRATAKGVNEWIMMVLRDLKRRDEVYTE